MRLLLVLIAAALAGCGSSSEEAAKPFDDTIKTIEKAEEVEDTVQQAVDDLDAAIDEASGE